MLSIFIFILLGIIVGYLIRNKSFKNQVGAIINIIIIVLLFSLGVAVGTNRQIIDNFATIGFEAFSIALATTVGSILCAWFVFNQFFKKKKEQ